MTSERLAETLLEAARDAINWRGHFMTSSTAEDRRNAIDGYNASMNHLADIVTQAEHERMKTRSWAQSLPVYECPRCGKQTVFKDRCGDCEDEIGPAA